MMALKRRKPLRKRAKSLPLLRCRRQHRSPARQPQQQRHRQEHHQRSEQERRHLKPRRWSRRPRQDPQQHDRRRNRRPRLAQESRYLRRPPPAPSLPNPQQNGRRLLQPRVFKLKPNPSPPQLLHLPKPSWWGRRFRLKRTCQSSRPSRQMRALLHLVPRQRRKPRPRCLSP